MFIGVHPRLSAADSDLHFVLSAFIRVYRRLYADKTKCLSAFIRVYRRLIAIFPGFSGSDFLERRSISAHPLRSSDAYFATLIFLCGCSIVRKTSSGKLAEIFTTLPLVVTLTDLISAAALGS